MACVQVGKDERLIARRAMDADKARRVCLVRLGGGLEAHLVTGQTTTVGPYGVRIVEGDVPQAPDVPAVSDAVQGTQTAGQDAEPSGSAAAEADLVPFVTSGGPADAERDRGSLPQVEGYEITGRLGEGGMAWSGVPCSSAPIARLP